MITVLCASLRSCYRDIPGLDIFDCKRDARTFTGTTPVIAHPPCRSWSKYCKHQAIPLPGEKELGVFCADKVRANGGILEQPAVSELFRAAGLPMPGWTSRADCWSIEVWQAWWGYPMKKKTWLFFSKISPNDLAFPYALHAPGQDRRRQQLMSKSQRSATTLAMALWMVNAIQNSSLL